MLAVHLVHPRSRKIVKEWNFPQMFQCLYQQDLQDVRLRMQRESASHEPRGVDAVLDSVIVPLVLVGFNAANVVTDAAAELLAGNTDEVERIAD